MRSKHRLRLCCILNVLQLFWCPVLQHPYRLGATLTILNAVAGAAAIYINWDSDHQRQVPVRGILASATCVHCGDKCMWILPCQTIKRAAQHDGVLLQTFRATGGKALIWGAKPQKITAHYTTADGTPKTSLLLASGRSLAHRHSRDVTHVPGAEGLPLALSPARCDTVLACASVIERVLLEQGGGVCRGTSTTCRKSARPSCGQCRAASRICCPTSMSSSSPCCSR
jgi:hypothetical protein